MLNGIFDNKICYNREKWNNGILVNKISTEALWDVRAIKCLLNICPFELHEWMKDEEMLRPWGFYPSRNDDTFYKIGDKFGQPPKQIDIKDIKF